MMRISKRLVPVLFAVFLVLDAALAAAAPVRRIHQIQRPLFNNPAIVRAGESFALEISTAPGVAAESAHLMGLDGGSPVNLALDNRDGALVAAVPADAPEALYDLHVRFSDASADSQPHAVKVVRDFKDDYVFVHLTDIHFNMGSDPRRNALRMKILDDVSKLNPEFVLFSGDLGLNPATYDMDYVFGYESLVQRLRAPVFMTPGNHEMYIDEVDGAVVDGRDYWEAAYGPSWHSFDYGPLHVMTISTYDWAPRWRDKREPDTVKLKINNLAFIGPEQWEWIQADAAAAARRGQSIIAHTHIPLEFLQGGNKLGLERPEIVQGPSLQKFTKFLNHYKVSHVFVGHVHFNSERLLGESVLEVCTMGAGHNPGDGARDEYGFRIVRVNHGKITGMELRAYSLEDSSAW